jgi:putative flippase GtrA
MLDLLFEGTPRAQLARFIINGLAATAVHFAALLVIVEGFQFPTAGGANLLASIVGIGASFLGNRYFVFRRTAAPVMGQAFKFVVLYAAIALIHGGFLFVWSDVSEFDYRIGFLLAMVLQFALSFSGTRKLVFTP